MSRLPVLLLCLAGPLAAQDVSIEFATRGVAGVYLGDAVQASAADQVIGGANPLVLDLIEFDFDPNDPTTIPSIAFASSAAGITSRRGARLDQSYFSFDLGPMGGGGSTLPGGTTASATTVQAAQVYDITLRSSVPIPGRIVVKHAGRADGGAVLGGSLQGPGRAIDLSANVSTELPLTLDAGGVTLVLESSFQASGGSLRRDLEIWFQADPRPGLCTFSSAASSCAEGGTITGSSQNFLTFEAVTIDLVGSTPHSIAFGLLSSTPDLAGLPIAFPSPSGCGFVTPDVHLFGASGGAMLTDGSGASQLLTRVSPAVLGAMGSVYFQAVTLDFRNGLGLVSSNVLEIACP